MYICVFVVVVVEFNYMYAIQQGCVQQRYLMPSQSPDTMFAPLQQ